MIRLISPTDIQDDVHFFFTPLQAAIAYSRINRQWPQADSNKPRKVWVRLDNRGNMLEDINMEGITPDGRPASWPVWGDHDQLAPPVKDLKPNESLIYTNSQWHIYTEDSIIRPVTLEEIMDRLFNMNAKLDKILSLHEPSMVPVYTTGKLSSQSTPPFNPANPWDTSTVNPNYDALVSHDYIKK